jgi:hypothetical protein
MSSGNQDLVATQIWHDFLELVGKGELPGGRIQSLDPKYDGILKGFIQVIQDSLLDEMLSVSPEIFHVGNKVHFILPLGKDKKKLLLLPF